MPLLREKLKHQRNTKIVLNIWHMEFTIYTYNFACKKIHKIMFLTKFRIACMRYVVTRSLQQNTITVDAIGLEIRK